MTALLREYAATNDSAASSAGLVNLNHLHCHIDQSDQWFVPLNQVHACPDIQVDCANSPDPFPRERVVSGNETTWKYVPNVKGMFINEM